MNDRIKNIVTVVLFAVILVGLAIFSWFGPEEKYSMSERRYLAEFPEISKETIMSGDAMKQFESYAVDGFPMRDSFRKLKAVFSKYVLLQKENNGNYYVDGFAAKLEYPLNDKSVTNAAEHFAAVYDKYLKDTDSRVYLSVIPDKSYFLAGKNGYPSLDYDKMVEMLRADLPYMEYVDIFPLLQIEDYYKTDTHWKQECITDVADKLVSAMEEKLPDAYAENQLEKDFYGVYYGQTMLPMKPEKITYLTNDVINGFKAYDFENSTDMEVYDMEAASGPDAYNLYLKGSISLLSVENPSAEHDKELIVFRDSFGSSIGPLLAQGYAKTTFIDIRYISSGFLGNFVDFDDADVLFLYSTGLLNNSDTLK